MKAKTLTDERENVRTMRLPVALTETEYKHRCSELATTVGDEAEKSAEAERAAQTAKAIKEDIAEELDTIQAKARELAAAVRTRSEPREVTVFDRKDYKAGEVQTVREDTGEIVTVRGAHGTTVAAEKTRYEIGKVSPLLLSSGAPE
jgi:hypothetical protein